MITLPLIHLLQACAYEERTQILRQIESHELDEAALFHLIELMEQYGSMAYTASLAQEYIEDAIQEAFSAAGTDVLSKQIADREAQLQALLNALQSNPQSQKFLDLGGTFGEIEPTGRAAEEGPSHLTKEDVAEKIRELEQLVEKWKHQEHPLCLYY